MRDKIAREWLQKAEEDFGFASAGLKHTDYFAQVCFHFHQAAEKYLKAFIVAHCLEFRPVHNLLELFEICRREEAGIEKIEEACRYLNPFYIDTRYPVHWPACYNKKTAMKAKEASEKIGLCLKGFLGIDL